jgi:hypothetical protein
MDPTYELPTGRICFRLVGKGVVDFLLAGNVSQAFLLQLSVGGVSGIVLPHGPFDIDRVGTVPLDEIGIVTVDNPQQTCNPLLGGSVQLSAQSGGLHQDIFRQVFQGFSFVWKEGFHKVGSEGH